MIVSQHAWVKKYGRSVVLVSLVGLLALLIVKQHTTLGRAVSEAAAADRLWLSLGIAAMALSVPATALVYDALAPKRLPFARTMLVQAAGFCINKLLPSGSGAAGVSFLYLRAQRIPAVLSGSIVALNNMLGLIGHCILLGSLLLLQPGVFREVHAAVPTIPTAAWIGVGLVAFLLIGLVVVFRTRLNATRITVGKQLRPLLRDKAALYTALVYSMFLTLCYVLTLLACAEAVGVHLSVAAAIVALSGSVLATSAIPAPGGIGAAELGAYGGLVAVGVDARLALAAALLYRVCSFWLPLAFGSIAFVVVTRRGYLKAAK